LRIDKWKSEISELKESIREINNENASSAYKLATAEVLLYNKKDLERIIRNEKSEPVRSKKRCS
jgi:hypothetical protein